MFEELKWWNADNVAFISRGPIRGSCRAPQLHTEINRRNVMVRTFIPTSLFLPPSS